MKHLLNNLRQAVGIQLSVLLLISLGSCVPGNSSKEENLPNFIIVFTDDQGYGDLSCFGSTRISTPNIDRMAAEGAKLTSFYVAAPVCTPSRAGLMTGCYPKRINMGRGSRHGVLLSADTKGLHPDEVTIAEVLKTKGYATGIIGKWHLGDQPAFLPTRQGFDEFFGIPYSHDIHPWHPRDEVYHFPDLPLLQGEEVIEMNPDMNQMTQRLTDQAVAFIENHKEEPFFLYLPHSLPHDPTYAGPEEMQRAPDSIRALLAQENGGVDYFTRKQLYPYSVETIDASVGRILEALKANGLAENTLVIFTSDNGPSRRGIGSAGPLKGGKGQTFEGGMREPTVAWWPGKIPPGSTNDEILTALDILPTFATLAGAEIPQDRVIDGKNIWPELIGEKRNTLPREPFFYHAGNHLQAVRYGDWKYRKQGKDSTLHNLRLDVGETENLLDQYPEIAEELRTYFNEFEQELGVGGQHSDQCRPAGLVDMPRPLTR